MYIGKNSGKRVLNEIYKAKESIRIISPFLDSNFIDHLIKLKNRGINVKLISSDEINDFDESSKSPILRKIIEQEQIVLEDEKIRRHSFYKFFLILLGIFIVYTIIAAVSVKYFSINLFLETWYIFMAFFALLFIVFHKYKNHKIYEYEYHSLFDGFFVVSPRNMTYSQKQTYRENTFLHSKVYIIDDRIAFIGSLNFTSAGFYKNFESCITIKDMDIIVDMIVFFENILQTDLLIKDIELYGKQFYDEPIN